MIIPRALVAFAALALFACDPVPASASGKPLAIAVSNVTITEGQTANPAITLSGGNGRAVTVSWKASDGESGALTFKGTASIAIAVPDDTIINGTRSITVTASVISGSVHPSASGTITVLDNDVAPPPPPPPPANSLAGETPILDNFTGGLVPTDGGARGIGAIAPASADDTGAFRMFCGAGQLNYDDPIRYPGQVHASHLHQYVGNAGANANSTYNSLRTTGTTTCGDPTTPLNRSAYWIPAMLDGVGNVVKPDYMNLYYKRLPVNSPGCTDPVKRRGICLDLPNGLRYIFGTNMATGLEGITDPNHFAYWLMTYNCNSQPDGSHNPGAAAGLYHTLKDLSDAGCPVGSTVVVVGFAEDCWDGVHLDTADHRAHMSYATGNDLGYGRQCDADHPYLIPDLQFQWVFTVDANLATWRLSSDDMMAAVVGHSVPAGSSLHMDYWEAWSPTAKAAWQDSCINGHLTCASGDLGNGTMIKGAGIPPGGFPTHVVVPVP